MRGKGEGGRARKKEDERVEYRLYKRLSASIDKHVVPSLSTLVQTGFFLQVNFRATGKRAKKK